MFLQGRSTVVWLSWVIGGVCGVIILLIVICYCRLMPHHQKSFDEQYLKDTYTIKENHVYSHNGNYTNRVKNAEVARHVRPASYAGDRPQPRAPPAQPPAAAAPAQYASSGMLDDLDGPEGADGAETCEALKTRSLPAFLRPRPRPLSSETDLYQLYAKVNMNKRHKSRMRSEHAALIALSKSRSQPLGDAAAVIVYDQRTQL